MFDVVCVDTRENAESKSVFATLHFNDEDTAKKYIWERAHADVDDMMCPTDITVRESYDYDGEGVETMDADKFAGMKTPDGEYPCSIVIKSGFDEGFINYSVQQPTAYSGNDDMLHLLRLRLGRLGSTNDYLTVECEIKWKEDMGKPENEVVKIVVGLVGSDAVKEDDQIFFYCHCFAEFNGLYNNRNEDFDVVRIIDILE